MINKIMKKQEKYQTSPFRCVITSKLILFKKYEAKLKQKTLKLELNYATVGPLSEICNKFPLKYRH